MHIAGLDEIKGALAGLDLLLAIEAGFVAYSEGRANAPPGGFANTADAMTADNATSPRSILTGVSQ